MRHKAIIIIGLLLTMSAILGGTIFSDISHSQETGTFFAAIVLCIIGLIFIKRRFGVIFMLGGIGLLLVTLLLQPTTILLVGYLVFMVISLWLLAISRVAFPIEDITLQLVEPRQDKYGRVQKSYWIQFQERDQAICEWDDIHLQSWFGDTIIHLGQTILPEAQLNTIIIQKAVGDIHLLLPFDIGIMLSHNTFKGSAVFEGEEYHLVNEQLKIYSENYLQAPRKIHIITTTYIGNIEVVRI